MARRIPRGIKQRHPLGSVAHSATSRTGVSPLTVVAVSSASTGVKISELPVASAASDTDQMEVNQGGVSKRLTLDQVATLVSSELALSATSLNAKDFGALGDGVTDDAAAINAALNAAVTHGSHTVMAVGTFRVASSINIPYGVTLDLGSFLPGNPAAGSRIIGDAAVSPVVNLGSGFNGTARLCNGTISRTGTSPGSTTIGILIADGYNVIADNVLSDNHGICWKFLGHPASGLGLGARITNGYSSRAVDAHILNDGLPELYWIGGRIGMNGFGDYLASTYIRCQGGVSGTAGGPNSCKFVSMQFNQGSNFPLHFWEFVNLGAGGVPGIDTSIMDLVDCHVEGVSSAVIYSDASWNYLQRLHWYGNTFNCPTIPFWALNAATTPSEWNLTDNSFYCSTFSVAPTNAINGICITGGEITGAMSLTGASGSVTSLHGIVLTAGFTLAGVWSNFTSVGMMQTGAPFTNTATGNVTFLAGDRSTLSSTTGLFVPLRINTTDTTALVISGTARGIRFVPGATFSSIEGVDNTGSASYQALHIGGSAVSIGAPLTTGAVNWVGSATGAVNVMAVTGSSFIVGLVTGAIYIVQANLANTTTTPTVNINGLGAKTIVKRAATPLAAGDYVANMMLQLLYDGVNMVLLNPVVN